MYKSLLDEAKLNGIAVYEKHLPNRLKGLYIGGAICINKNTTQTEKTCTLAEELGHYHTSVGNILDQSKTSNRKQELRARDWANKRLITLDTFIDAFYHGVKNSYEFAEFAGVTEEFLHETIKFYQRKYGLCTTHNGYIIYFENVVVVKLFEWLYIVLHYIFFNSKSNIRSKIREKHYQNNDI